MITPFEAIQQSPETVLRSGSDINQALYSDMRISNLGGWLSQIWKRNVLLERRRQREVQLRRENSDSPVEIDYKRIYQHASSELTRSIYMFGAATQVTSSARKLGALVLAVNQCSEAYEDNSEAYSIPIFHLDENDITIDPQEIASVVTAELSDTDPRRLLPSTTESLTVGTYAVFDGNFWQRSARNPQQPTPVPTQQITANPTNYTITYAY
jgi:hypothetical protein